MSKKPSDPRQMPLNFDDIVTVDMKHTTSDARFVAVSPVAVCHGPPRAHGGGIGATIVSFTDAGTLALRRRAVQRVICAGIFPAPSSKVNLKD